MDARFEPYLRHLRALPFTRAVRVLARKKGARATPAIVAIRTPRGEERLQVEIQDGPLSPELLEHWARRTTAARLEQILFIPAVGRAAGDRMEALGISFMDHAGNCYVNLSDRYISRVQARQVQTRRAADKGFRGPAYQALFALLAAPKLVSAPVRELADSASVSRQAATDIRPRLESLGILYQAKDRFGWVPGRAQAAVDIFITGYSTTLRPRLLLGSFRTAHADPGELEDAIAATVPDFVEANLRWGGGAAAMRIHGHYHGPNTIVHADSLESLNLKRCKAVPDRNGPFEVLRIPGPLAREGVPPETVHPLLVYAELLREHNDRAREAGQQILDEWLSSQAFE